MTIQHLYDLVGDIALWFGIYLFILFLLFLACDGCNPLTYFKAYRRWRGGRWRFDKYTMTPFLKGKWVRIEKDEAWSGVQGRPEETENYGD